MTRKWISHSRGSAIISAMKSDLKGKYYASAVTKGVKKIAIYLSGQDDPDDDETVSYIIIMFFVLVFCSNVVPRWMGRLIWGVGGGASAALLLPNTVGYAIGMALFLGCVVWAQYVWREDAEYEKAKLRLSEIEKAR